MVESNTSIDSPGPPIALSPTSPYLRHPLISYISISPYLLHLVFPACVLAVDEIQQVLGLRMAEVQLYYYLSQFFSLFQ